ncbi:aromatic ring-hydroxylating oxygenase subunit alpha [Aliiroseovarius sp.]|uniref:aromatic ring-hydroxylating oxygenase subunit alpha n=1 Tax=Aliiroseovarius sp. TaxID=1872442 RepID=UPI003BAB4DCB
MNEHVNPQVPIDAGLFDPDNPETSWTLPADWYYRPDIHEMEREAIFFRTWSYVCHVSDVRNPGDYFCAEIAGQGVFIIRDRAGELRAFYNVCSHRAHPLLEGSGNTNLIVCPYHQWCYQSDGCFRGARGRDTLKSWIPENANLKPVRLESYGGLLFVNLDPDAVPLIEQAPKLLKDIYTCCPRFDDLIRISRNEFEVAANWKTIVDNNHECYHCHANHPSLMELVDYDTKAVWSDDGITFSHTVERKEIDNSAYALERDAIAQDSLFSYIWPSHIPLFFPGSPSMVMFQVLPLGPERSLIRHDWFLLSDQPGAQEAALMDWFSGTLAQEDMGICEKVQKALHSRGYKQGKFVVDRDHPEFSEHHVHFFQQFVYRALMA